MSSTQKSHTSPADLGIVPGGYTRVAAILAVRPLMESFGVAWADLRVASGLRSDQFDDPEHLISFRQASRLLGLCADRAGCEHLGVLTGRQTKLHALGMVGDLALAAPDLRSALDLISRYLTLSDGGGLASLSEGEHYASYGYAIYEPGVERGEIVYDHVMGVAWNALRELCGNTWLPHEVMLARRRPTDIRPYRNFFRAPLRFDAAYSAMVFERDWLEQPIASADAARLRELLAKVRRVEAEAAGDLPNQVRRVLRRQLLSDSASMESVAAELSMHRRTLDRKLTKFAVSFQALNDDVRYEVARQLLDDTQMPVIAIAQSLHYNDTSAFTHAFRRWSGSSPKQWRESAGWNPKRAGMKSR